MRTCPHCRRHAFATERACPFCGGGLPLADGPRGIGVALGLALASCGGGSAGSGGGGSTSGPTSPGPSSQSSTSSTMADGTSALGTTDDGGAFDDDGAGCGGFYGGCVPDGGPVVFECDLVAQDCPEGEKCMPWARDGGVAWNATRCTPLAARPVPVGGACTVEDSAVSGIDDCDIGLMCWNVDEDGAGHCEDFCTGSEDSPLCESPQDVCLFANDGAIALCLTACDPVVQDCAPTEGCWPQDDAWACVPDFSQFGSLPGDACTWSPDCAPGLVCLEAGPLATCAGEEGCCTPVCDATAADADAPCTAIDPTATCRPWYADGQAPWGLEHVGVCMADDEPDPTTGG